MVGPFKVNDTAQKYADTTRWVYNHDKNPRIRNAFVLQDVRLGKVADLEELDALRAYKFI